MNPDLAIVPTETHAAALEYAARGRPVFPVGLDKKPVIGKEMGGRGFKDATTDPGQINEWWMVYPWANVATPTGPDGCGANVVDCDSPDAIVPVVERFSIGDGPRVLTPRGGAHVYMRANGRKFPTKNGKAHPELREVFGRADVDTKGEGGYVLLPPSKTEAGVYKWIAPELPLPPTPPALFDALEGRAVSPTGVNAVGTTVPTPPDNIADHRGFSIDAWVDRYLTPLDVDGPAPWEGGRRWVLGVCPWTENHSDPNDTRGAHVEQHASGAISAGCHHASCGWGWAELRKRFEGRRPGRVTVTAAPGNGASDDAEIKRQYGEAIRFTEVGNANAFVARHGKNLRYIHTWGKWAAWAGNHWRVDDDAKVWRLAKRSLEAAAVEAVRTNSTKLAQFAVTSNRRNALGNLLDLASKDKPIAVTHEPLDSHPWLLNVKNGTLDLKTCEIRAHARADMLTHCLDVVYDPNATCAKWDTFLKKILPSPGLREFVQRAVGYTLTGDTGEDCLFMLFGTGANGKTTFLEAIRALLGPQLAKAAPMDMLTTRSQDGGASPSLARLQGARMASAVESDEGRRLAEAKIKQMTGGDKIAARFLYQNDFEYTPQFKLWIGTNHKPGIRGTDEAIWRRIRLVPFAVTIPEEDRNPDLLGELLKELPGILAWAVKGCRAWKRDRLGTCDEVTAATAEYRSEEDVVAQFVSEECYVGYGAKCAKPRLTKAFDNWCEAAGNRHGKMSTKKLTARLKSLYPDIDEARDKNSRWWVGLGLKVEPDAGDRCDR